MLRSVTGTGGLNLDENADEMNSRETSMKEIYGRGGSSKTSIKSGSFMVPVFFVRLKGRWHSGHLPPIRSPHGTADKAIATDTDPI